MPHQSFHIRNVLPAKGIGEERSFEILESIIRERLMAKFDRLIVAMPPTPNGDLHSDIPGIEQRALSL